MALGPAQAPGRDGFSISWRTLANSHSALPLASIRLLSPDDSMLGAL